MNIAATHIAHLMSSESSLSLSGLGSFERVEIPAVYNPELHTILPPETTISFEPDTSAATSEALISSLMRSNCCDRSTAMQTLEGCGRAICEEIKTSGSCRFEGLGILRKVADGKIEMQLSEDFVDKKAQRWLPEITLSPLVRDVRPLPFVPIDGEDSVASIHTLPWRRVARVASAWAAAVVIFGIVALVTVFANRFVDNNGVNMASPIATTSHISYKIQMPQVQSVPLVLIFRTPEDAVDDARIRPTRHLMAESSDSYYLVVASLSNEAEAIAFIEQNSTPAIPLYLLQSKGYHRVYAMSGDSPETVLQKAAGNGINDVYQSAWVCHR